MSYLFLSVEHIFILFILIMFIVLGGYILKVHSTYGQVEAVKRENKYSVLSQHLSTATRAVGYSPPPLCG